MEIRRIEEYRFYTTTEFDNPLHDRRHRYGIHAKASFPAGTQVRVEVMAVLDRNGLIVGEPVKHYYIGTYPAGQMAERLASMDPGHDEPVRSLDDLAARNVSSPEWFSHTALERLIADGVVTFGQVQAAWDRVCENEAING